MKRALLIPLSLVGLLLVLWFGRIPDSSVYLGKLNPYASALISHYKNTGNVAQNIQELVNEGLVEDSNNVSISMVQENSVRLNWHRKKDGKILHSMEVYFQNSHTNNLNDKSKEPIL